MPAVPIATYRLQLTKDFGFDDAAALVPYLKALGISHLYASPFLKARANSSHGYDVVDHNAFNPELGNEPAFERLSRALREAGMGLLLDFVPNHMGVHFADNSWWLDVLEWGPRSPYASFFDIDWETLPAHPGGGVLIPILGRPYGEALEAGEIELRYDDAKGSFSVWYHEHRMPIALNRYGEILHKVVAAAEAGDTGIGRSLLAIAAHYRGPHNPPREQAQKLRSEITAVGGAKELIERGLAVYRPATGSAAIQALHYLLERQHYRLAYWRLAGSEINYRRFFDINTLAGLRVQNVDTFQAIHRLVRRLIAANRLQGLRLDHIDGLQDPQQYFRRLQRLIEEEGADTANFYLVVEKILAEGEKMPGFAGVSGTTGYEWLNAISRLLIDDGGLRKLDRTWQRESGDARDFHDILVAAKRRVIETILASEFTVLARLLARLAGGYYGTRDFAADRLRAALELFIVHFPIYRTYLTASGPSAEDRKIITAAIDKARAEWFGPDAGIFDFLRDALTLDLTVSRRGRHSAARNRRFAFKVQQFTGPMMAKSLEDTAFYRYHRLLALNEVGGDPAADALSASEFHRLMQERMAAWPHGLTATATHDTKRGEDARARLLALPELADEWEQQIEHWRQLNEKLLDTAQPRAPTAAHQYMLYQSLLGAWPLERRDESFVERMQAFAVKAAREGKERTSWLAPDESYEAGLTSFVHRLLDPDESAPFLRSFDAFARRTALIGALNSLVQVTLKATIPGVPDFYQGTELWDLSLVDPDNRRPVDFAARRSLLRSLESADWPELAGAWPDGRIKFALTLRLLALRRQYADLFSAGVYQPLQISGPRRNEVVAFARRRGEDAVIVVVGRGFGCASDEGRRWPSAQAWDAEVSLDEFSQIRNVLWEREAASDVSGLFGVLPVAVLHARTQSGDDRLYRPKRP